VLGSLTGFDFTGSDDGGVQNIQVAPDYQNMLQSGLSVGSNAAISPLTFLFGFLGLLVLLRIIADAEHTDFQPAHIHIGAFNTIVVGSMALVWIVLFKIIGNSSVITSLPYTSGFTQLVNAA